MGVLVTGKKNGRVHYRLQLSMLFFTKSQSFKFTNKDPATKCWGGNMLAQRGRKKHPADLPPLPVFQKKSFLVHHLQQNSSN